MTDESDVAPDVSPVIDRLEEIRLETGYDLYRVFRDWMALAVYAFEGNDPDYHDRLDRYAEDPHDQETRATVARLFSEALGELTKITVETQRPVVGDVYEETNNQNEDDGQFFTPWNVCVAKAEMLISEEDAEEATRSDPLRVADPACGSARLLVATAMKLHEIDPDAAILVQGTDKDRTCARMAVVNLALGNIPGRIRFGDSLTQEIHEVWHVVPDSAGKPVRRLDDDEIPDVPDADDDSDDEDPDYEQQKLITDGGGDQSTDDTERCQKCLGKGYYTVPGLAYIARRPTCDMCGGSGRRSVNTDTDQDIRTDGGTDTSMSDVEDFYPTDCVLCDHSAETFEEHEQHMAEVHDTGNSFDQYDWSEELPWRERILRLQTDQPPKSAVSRGTYYYTDGFDQRRQIWVKHKPGMNPGISVSKILKPGMLDDPYTDLTAGESLDLTETEALKLYHALDAYFSDDRSPPYWMDMGDDRERDEP